MHGISRIVGGSLLGVGSLVAVLIGAAGPAMAAPTCVNAGLSGMTAVVVATTGQNVTGTIDATGCDLGIYVGPGVNGVTIENATISGANEHAIYVQDTFSVTIQHNTITGNVTGGGSLTENEAVDVAGSSMVKIVHNSITNNGGGGIAITDDGSNHPGSPNAGLPLPATVNIVVQNTVTDNTGGNGIVVAGYNSGQGVSGTIMVANTVERNDTGIVVETDATDTSATNNFMVNNTTNDNGAPGIAIHSNMAGDSITGTKIVNNRISGNATAGIELATGDASATLDNTLVVANRISNETTAISQSGDTNTRMVANKIS